MAALAFRLGDQVREIDATGSIRQMAALGGLVACALGVLL